MGIDWQSNPTGLYYRIGRLVAAINNHGADGSGLAAELAQVMDPYNRSALTSLVAGLSGLYGSWQQQAGNMQRLLAGHVDLSIVDADTVQSFLGLTNAGLTTVLPLLRAQALVDGQTFKKCTTALGSLTPGAGNRGNGTVLLTRLLDGVTPPLLNGSANAAYAGLLSELCVPSETMTFTCGTDSVSGSATEGSELFSWQGGQKYLPFDWHAEGSGAGPRLICAGNPTLIANASFEQWEGSDGNTPSGWTIDGGTPGVNIFHETGIVARGSSSLKIVGDGSTGTIGIHQAIVPGMLTPLRMLACSIRFRSSSVPAAGRFQVYLSGTGYTPGASERINLAAASFPTAAFSSATTLLSFFVILPQVIPSDVALHVAVTNTLSNAVSLYLDSLTLDGVNYHGGFGAQVVPGTVPFQVGDTFTVVVSNDQAGTAQDFFRRWYRIQMPSATSGSETVSDTLFM